MSSPELERSISGRNQPIGQEDVKISFPSGRDSRLPDVYLTNGHPQHSGDGKAYYFLHDGTREGSEKTYKLEVEELKIPQGPREDAIAMGFLELLPGDIIFSRLTTDPASGVEDVPVAWVTGEEIYSPELCGEAMRVRNVVLGDARQRSGTFPERNKDTGILEGGTAWERSLQGKINRKRGRCYPFGCTFQKAKSLYSPCAAGKHSVVDEATLKMRTDLTKILTEMAMLSLKKGPVNIVDAIRLNHDIFNTPLVGASDNFAYTSNQLNLAHMKEWESDESLADSMGRKFGGAHIDQLDSPGHFTNMIALSDLPKDSDPGRFFIVYPGIFCTLGNFVSVNFSGLRVHGGSPPIAHKDAVLSVEEKNAATRFTGVCYAKIGPTSSERKMPLIQTEVDKIISITPEMLRPGDIKLPRTFTSTNFVTEGPSVMSSSSLIEFLARCFLLLILSLISQLPASLDVQVDADSFLSSFHYLDESGNRNNVGPWESGPGWREDSDRRAGVRSTSRTALVSQKVHRGLQLERWKQHKNRCGGHIPSAVCCLPDIKPLQGWSAGDPLVKMKPLLFNKGKGVDETSSDEETPEPDARPAKKKKNKRAPRKKGTSATSSKSSQRAIFSSSAVAAEGGGVTSKPIPRHTHRLVPYVLVPSVSSSYHTKEVVQEELSDETSSGPSHHEGTHSSSESSSAVCSSGVSAARRERIDRSGVNPPAMSRAISPPYLSMGTPRLTDDADSSSSEPPSGTLGGDVERADNSPDKATSSGTPPPPVDISSNEIVVGITSSEARTAGKRPRSVDCEDLYGPDKPQDLDEAPSSKRRHVGLSRIWTSETYRRLEISITECGPINVNYTGAARTDLGTSSEVPGLSSDVGRLNELEDLGTSSELPGMSSAVGRLDELENLRCLPKYLQGLTSDLIHGEYVAVEDSIFYLAGYRNSFDTVQTVNSLMLLHDRVCVAPLDLSSLTSVRTAWQGMEYLLRSEHINTIRLKKIRACIMLTSSVAWRWLLVSIPEAIRNIQYQADVQCEWMADLMWAMKQALLMRRKNAKFVASQFFWPLDSVRPAIVDFSDLLIPGELDHESWISFYTECISQILQVWLGYPTGDSRAQGIFAFNVIRTVGPEFLLLDFIWTRFQTANDQLIRMCSLPEQINISEYPLLCPDSILRREVSRMSALIDDYVSGRLYRYTDFDAQTNTYIERISDGMRDLSVQRIKTFKLFMKDCFAVVFRGEKIGSQKLYDCLRYKTDKFSPFREHAPSRVHIRQPGGPFASDALQTKLGIYGVMLQRGVTFATPFSRHGRTLFESPADFRKAVRECDFVFTQKDYCDSTAYGTANPGRKPALADIYWHQLELFPWVDGMTATSKIPFEKAYEFFYPSSVKPRFPMLGSLGAYLLTVDYVYAGLVAPPSSDELAILICNLNKGAAKALYFLGLLPQKIDTDKAPRDQKYKLFGNAFKVANDIIKDSIPQEYHDEAGLDIFVTEHSLCKFMRAYKQCDLTTALV